MLKFQFSVEYLFLIIVYLKLFKLCIWIKLFTFKNTKAQINDHKIDWNHDTGFLIIKTWGKNELKKFDLARFQLENQSAPARLGSELSYLGSAQAGKFQLGLITTKLLRIQCMKLQNIMIFHDRRWFRHDIFELLQPLFFC